MAHMIILTTLVPRKKGNLESTINALNNLGFNEVATRVANTGHLVHAECSLKGKKSQDAAEAMETKVTQKMDALVAKGVVTFYKQRRELQISLDSLLRLRT